MDELTIRLYKGRGYDETMRDMFDIAWRMGEILEE